MCHGLPGMLKQNQYCPCGRLNGKRALSYALCCGRYLDHFETTPAPDAESLMRSRYTAFVLERDCYLRDTWLAEKCPDLLAVEPDVKWLGLEVRAHRQLDADHAEVEFVARNRLQGRASRLHETSRFVRLAGRRLYVDGVVRP